MPVNTGRVGLLCAALESGLYEQGTGTLHRKYPDGRHTWCCLGAAGDIVRKFGLDLPSHWVNPFLDPGHECEPESEYIDNEVNFLGPAVMAWYGFEDRNPVLTLPDGRQSTAAALNDGQRDESYPDVEVKLDFEGIAQAFRRTFLERADDPR